MWHTPQDFQGLQEQLAERGYSSFAIDLKPGERPLPGFTQKAIVADVEKSLEGMSNFVLLGHSQGGLVAQSILRNSLPLRGKTRAVVLLGTFPLGLRPPMALLKQERSMYTFPGYLFVSLFGKLMNAAYAKHIFFMPSTNDENPSVQTYIQRTLKAPADGFITMTHFINPGPAKPSCGIPCLVLGGGGDIIYPPPMLKSAFDDRFDQATHVVAQGQAHCFVDPGWQDSMAKPLVDWLDQIPV